MEKQLFNHVPDAFALPSPDELKVLMKERFYRQAYVMIDRWPADIAALSVPTILIPLDKDIEAIFASDDEAALPVLEKYAAAIDAAIGWRPHFIRLTSRSPKDVSHPGLPITCAGKQAMSWIMNSERCMDDIALAHAAGERLQIALRQLYHAPKGGEFRCFAKDGKMIAMTRYDFQTPVPEGFEYDGKDIFARISAWYDDKIAKHYQTVVFDVDLGSYEHEEPLLIELNPYGMSHPCLFASYDEIEESGGFRA